MKRYLSRSNFAILLAVILLLVGVLSPVLSTKASADDPKLGLNGGSQPAQPTNSDTGTNWLVQIASQCQNTPNTSTGSVDHSGCNDFANYLSPLGCNAGSMFYQVQQNNAGTANNVGNWFINEGNYKDCYNKAETALTTLKSNTCNPVKNNSDDWNNTCQPAQNNLHAVLGCSDAMFSTAGSDGSRTIEQDKLSDCESRVNAVGNENIQVVDADGNVSTDPNQISSSKVSTTNSGNGTGSGEDAGGNGGDDSSPTCEDNGFAGSWIFCTIINGAADGMDSIYNNIIQPLLVTKPIDISNNGGDNTQTYQIWSNFRIYGDIFLVIALLVIVFGESIGGGLIDAYSAKKILPRLLIAAILINLSIYLVALAVDLTNIVGDGLINLLESPFKTQIASGNAYVLQMSPITGTIGSGAAALTVGIIVKHLFDPGSNLIGSGLMYLLVFVLIPAFFLFLAIMCTVVFRRGLILFLIFLAPVAFALYCLPNTEKYFRQWWDTLFRALLIYPIIAVMFALGNILSVTTTAASTGVSGAIASLVGMVAMFVPLVLIPYSFRIAGGVLGRFHDFATQGAKMTHNAVRGSEKDPDSLRSRTARNMAIRRNEAGLSSKEMTQRFLSNPQEWLTERGRERRRTQMGIARGAMANKYGQQVTEADTTFQAYKQDDMTLLAIANRGISEQKLNSDRSKLRDLDAKRSTMDQDDYQRQRNQLVANIDARSHSQQAADQVLANGSPAVRQQALMALAATGYQFSAGEEGYNELSQTVDEIAGPGNPGARAQLMNSAQYTLRAQGGRGDLGNIDFGAGSKKAGVKDGIQRMDSFTRGRSKTDTYVGGAQAWLGVQAGSSNVDQIRTDMAAALGNGETSLDDIVQWHGMLTSDFGSATDKNKLEIKKQLDAIDKLVGAQVMAQARPQDTRQDNHETMLIRSMGPNASEQFKQARDKIRLNEQARFGGITEADRRKMAEDQTKPH